MIKKILLVLLLLILAFCVVVALRPADFRITRSITVAAPAAAIFPLVNDFHQWEAWSPWAKLDPKMSQDYGGSPAGTGATYHWAGNSEVGEGKMTITESRPSDLVSIRLEFLKPIAATNQADFTFQPQGNDILVTWTMTGRNNFVGKAAHLVMNIDKMVGKDFEKGLGQIKALAEAKPRG
jgi:hypothetical protein